MTEIKDVDRQGREGLLSCFLWRPWYAKLWWGAAALFWLAAMVVSWLAPDWARGTDSGLLPILVIIFHPFIIVPVLGLRLYWRWVANDTFAWPRKGVSEERDEDDWLYGEDGAGFRPLTRRGFAHPIDPRSPLNPINPLYRINHGDR